MQNGAKFLPRLLGKGLATVCAWISFGIVVVSHFLMPVERELSYKLKLMEEIFFNVFFGVS
jgi:hypothetical protein